MSTCNLVDHLGAPLLWGPEGWECTWCGRLIAESSAEERWAAATADRDMRTLAQLKKEGHRSAKMRGHTLGRWKPTSTNRQDRAAYATCLRCERVVYVSTHPPPNGIDLGGDAVAMNCRDKEHTR